MSRLLVTQYQAEVEKIIRYGGSKKETSIRNAFERLLNDYCKPRNYLLVPELDFKTRFNTTVYPDGTIKDAIRLEHGWWESKDEYDKLDLEIEKKFEKGYPDENILFEDSQNAVLIQHSREIGRVSMQDAEALDRLLNIFVDYERPEVRDFRAAIAKFKEDIPSILDKLRETIQIAEKENQEFCDRRNAFLAVCRQSINPEISIFDVHEMLIQHILTEDIFTNIFHESQFHRENNIARELSAMLDTFFTGTIRRNTLKSIEYYYAVIRRSSENIANHHEKQKFLKALYENFYKAYNPKAADRLGIVYTPNEIVRFMIESADQLVHKHFGKLLSDEGVEILIESLQELLLFMMISDILRTTANHRIVILNTLQRIAARRSCKKRIDHRRQLTRNIIFAMKLRLMENICKNILRENMLNQHLMHIKNLNLRINRLPTHR